MPTQPRTRSSILIRRPAAAALAALVIGGVCGLLLPAAAQDPGKKPPEEVEEKAPHKPKVPLRVDDDEPDGKSSRGDRSASARLAELGAEAARAKHQVLRDLYQEFSVAHDLVYYTAGTGKLQKIEPHPRRILESTSKRESLRLRPVGEKGPRAAPFEVKASSVRRIEPFEELALGRVKELIDPKGYGKALPRRDVLEAAERILSAVIAYHESAREQGVRQGADWNELVQRLRAEMVEVQVQTLGLLAEERNWEAGLALAIRLSEAYPNPEIRARFAKPMSAFIGQALDARDYVAARQRIRLLEPLFPDSDVTAPVRSRLAATADDLVKQAQGLMESDRPRALKLLDEARLLAPQLPSLRTAQMKAMDTFQILNVGVRRPPEFLTPDTANTDTERQAVEFLFESLVEPVAEPGRGTRYVPCLAAERPRQVPLGRAFSLSREAFWSDGTQVTAQDVIASYARLKERGDADLIDSVRSGEDAFHVTVSLRQGYLDPLSLMTFKILPDRNFADRREAAAFSQNPTVSGPYRLQRRDKDATYFTANFNYHRSNRPGMPRIQLVKFYRPNNAVTDFRKPQDRLHVLLDLPTRAVPGIRSIGSDVNVHTLPNRRIYFLAVNHADPNQMLRDPLFRRALALAIDRNRILDRVFRAGLEGNEKKATHRPLNGPYPPQSWAFNPNTKEGDRLDPHSPRHAKTLAEKSTGYAPGTRLVLKYPDDDPDVKQACEEMRKDVLDHVGVELQLEACSPAKLRQDVEVEHQYQLAYYHLDYPDESYRIAPWLNPRNRGPGGRNFLGYTPDHRLSQLMSQASNHRQFSAVQRYAHEIHQAFIEQMPFIPLWQLDTHLAIHRTVETHPNPERLDPLRVFQDLEQWQLSRDR